MSDEHGACVAPSCGAETPSRYHRLCKACEDRVERAMQRARPALLELMTRERAEAEAWLAADWSPPRRWVVADDDYHPEPIDAVVARMVEATADDWCAPHLGFVDDATWERRARWWREHDLEHAAVPQTAWLVPAGSETATAWRAHLAPLLRAALERALATFPLEHAGREIQDALLGRGGYDHEDAGGALDELWEGSGETGLSEDAQAYLDLRYYPSPTWGCDATDGIYERFWRRYRVLPDDIMAILDADAAADEADAAREQAAGEDGA